MEFRTLWFLLVLKVIICGAIEPISIAAGTVAALSALWGYVDKSPCRLMECCDNRSVSFDAKNVTVLAETLSRNVYGQHLMQDVVIKALRGHILTDDPKKALVLSFHGTTGCGKSYVSDFIAQSLFAKGMKSRFVKKFVAGNDFPDKSASMMAIYRRSLGILIPQIVEKCERALFIFEDVHLMPPGVLDGIVPFIDYHSNVDGLDFRKTIFIFLSNAGAKLINVKTLDLWSSGKQREDIIKLTDFESIIKQGSFNEEGGLHKSDTITASLIDHYVPFLPLEEKHVRRCIDDDFRKFGYTSPPEGAVEKILEEMTWMPTAEQLYSTSGCKRVGAKVSAYVYGERFVSFG